MGQGTRARFLGDVYGTVSVTTLSEEADWHEKARNEIGETLRDLVLSKLLDQSNLTKTQFETILVDQLGSDLANKTLTREEMTYLRQVGGKISRGAFFRTLQQARSNISESIHTVLLLGYSGLLESPSLAPFLEASERLRSQTEQLKEDARNDPMLYHNLVSSLLEDLERARDALQGRERDT